MEANKLFSIRPVDPDDIPFLFNSWLKSFRDSPMVKAVPNSIYFAEHHKVIEGIFKSAGCLIGIACNPSDFNQIYGYIVGEGTTNGLVLHWLYIKHPFRGNGIAKALFEWLSKDQTQFTFTHKVKNVEKLIGERPFTFNPYLLNRVAINESHKSCA